jgi:hypothetical protein
MHLPGETFSVPVTWFGNITCQISRDNVMDSHIDNSEGIDRKTSRSICDAVGERLQQHLRPLESGLPSHLVQLMDELRRQDAGGGRPYDGRSSRAGANWCK